MFLVTVATTAHGMPRIGAGRELKWALEGYWSGNAPAEELAGSAARLRRQNWDTMIGAGIDLIPSNDFSFYDHVLDAAVAVGAVPARYRHGGGPVDLDTYFAMARGGRLGGEEVAALELTKWFDTNYHYLVPELGPQTALAACPDKAVGELGEADAAGVTNSKPVLLGPLSLLLLSRPEEPGFDIWKLLDPLIEVYADLLGALAAGGAAWVQLDEPVLVADRTRAELAALERVYRRLGECPTRPKMMVSTYFGAAGEAIGPLVDLPIEGIGLDFCAGPANLGLLAETGGIGDRTLFAGVIDGRNVWAADLDATVGLLERLAALAPDVVVSTSCSLMHVPASVGAEDGLDAEVASWLAFAEEKLSELVVAAQGLGEGRDAISDALAANRAVLERRCADGRLSDPAVRRRLADLSGAERRPGTPQSRQAAQSARLGLPSIPTTTIGSFPQTPELRAARASWRAGRLDDGAYRAQLRAEVDQVIALQDQIGLDVMVHGEPERDDMVRYFAEQHTGFALPQTGWVQSYGSRCVRPPILFGDVSRPGPITLEWATYAASRTTKPIKGMLTGPVTMLAWSFVRDDQAAAQTAAQLALAVADEVADLDAAGIGIIQVDEPGLPERLPLRQAERGAYLDWATRAFRLAVAPAGETTQVHTHMCYAEFSDIAAAMADLDVDVISLEAARSQMTAVGTLTGTAYLGGIGPGIYDVHSPRVPDVDELADLLTRAVETLGAGRVWANPDCGLKTRRYDQVVPALANLVAAARQVRDHVDSPGHR